MPCRNPTFLNCLKTKKPACFSWLQFWVSGYITGACQAVNGKLVICDFSTAGLYANGRAKVDSQFTATPFELEWFRQPTAQTDTFPQCSPDMLAHFEKNKVLFQDLPEELIAEQADILSNLIIEELEQWTERLGPLKSIDRRHLYWVISERIAFLQRRFPAHLAAKPNCGLVQLKITPAAQRAIEASGISGHCLPATPGDIRKGELRLYTMLNRHNQPVTEAWVKLSPSACRRLSDNLGLPAPWHRRLEILDFYINQAFQKNCQDDVLRTMKMNDYWQDTIQQLINNCQEWLEEISHEHSRYPNGTVTQQTEAAIHETKYLLQALNSRKEGEDLWLEQTVQFPEWKAEAGFPARVVTQDKRGMCRGHLYRLKYHNSGRAWETGETQSINPPKNKDQGTRPVHYILLPKFNWLPEEEKSIDAFLFADNLPDDHSFTGTLRLRLPGCNAKVSQSLIHHLQTLGIRAGHCSPEEAQAHYERSLANCMSPNPIPVPTPQWFNHCRIINGKPVYYRPASDVDKTIKDQKHVTLHVFNNAFIRARKCTTPEMTTQLTSETNRALTNILHSGQSIDSYVDRVRKGIPLDQFVRAEQLKSGGASRAFAVSNYSSEGFKKAVFVQVKPLIRQRLDAYTYNFCRAGNSKPEFVQLYKVTPEQYADGSTMFHANETCFENFSLEETDPLHVPDEATGSAASSINEDTLRWPDGQDFRMASPEETVEHEFMRVTQATHPDSPSIDAAISVISAAGPHQYEKLCLQNPDLKRGVIQNLDDITFALGSSIRELNFQQTSMHNTVFKGVLFTSCTFNAIDLRSCDITNAEFEGCQATGAKVTPPQLLASKHYIDQKWHCQEWVDLMTDWKLNTDISCEQFKAITNNDGLIDLISFSPEEIERYRSTDK